MSDITNNNHEPECTRPPPRHPIAIARAERRKYSGSGEKRRRTGHVSFWSQA